MFVELAMVLANVENVKIFRRRWLGLIIDLMHASASLSEWTLYSQGRSDDLEMKAMITESAAFKRPHGCLAASL